MELFSSFFLFKFIRTMKKALTILLLLMTSCIQSVGLIDVVHLLNVKESKDETSNEVSKFLKKK
jgi:hypothetical protein